MKIRKFHKYDDAGHGWLKVSVKDILKYMNVDDIMKLTSYSYYRNGYVFLEEDCDMSLFCNVLESKDIKFEIIRHHTDKQSKIRNYDDFDIKTFITVLDNQK